MDPPMGGKSCVFFSSLLLISVEVSLYMICVLDINLTRVKRVVLHHQFLVIQKVTTKVYLSSFHILFSNFLALIINSIGNIRLCRKMRSCIHVCSRKIERTPKLQYSKLTFFYETVVKTVGKASSHIGVNVKNTVYFQSIFLTNSRRQSLIDKHAL